MFQMYANIYSDFGAQIFVCLLMFFLRLLCRKRQEGAATGDVWRSKGRKEKQKNSARQQSAASMTRILLRNWKICALRRAKRTCVFCCCFLLFCCFAYAFVDMSLAFAHSGQRISAPSVMKPLPTSDAVHCAQIKQASCQLRVSNEMNFAPPMPKIARIKNVERALSNLIVALTCYRLYARRASFREKLAETRRAIWLFVFAREALAGERGVAICALETFLMIRLRFIGDAAVLNCLEIQNKINICLANQFLGLVAHLFARAATCCKLFLVALRAINVVRLRNEAF